MSNAQFQSDTLSTRDEVATAVRAHFAVRNIKDAAAARLINKSQSWMSRRTTGETAFDTDDLGLIADALGLSYIDLIQMPTRPARAGAAGISSIVNMDDVRKVGPTGLEPMTSTVEERRFTPGWIAPVTSLRKVVA